MDNNVGRFRIARAKKLDSLPHEMDREPPIPLQPLDSPVAMLSSQSSTHDEFQDARSILTQASSQALAQSETATSSSARNESERRPGETEAHTEIEPPTEHSPRSIFSTIHPFIEFAVHLVHLTTALICGVSVLHFEYHRIDFQNAVAGWPLFVNALLHGLSTPVPFSIVIAIFRSLWQRIPTDTRRTPYYVFDWVALFIALIPYFLSIFMALMIREGNKAAIARAQGQCNVPHIG